MALSTEALPVHVDHAELHFSTIYTRDLNISRGQCVRVCEEMSESIARKEERKRRRNTEERQEDGVQDGVRDSVTKRELGP